MTIPFSQLYIAGGGFKTVSSASTAMPLATTTPCCLIQYTAPSTMGTAVMVIGDSTVRAQPSTRVGKSIAAGSSTGMIYAKDLSNIYLDTTVNGTGISYVYYLNTVP